MNTTIKKRIEEINSGRVPEGYEKTSFGIFPCDWEKSCLGDLFNFSGGLGKSREELGDKGVCYLHYGDMHVGDFNKVSYSQYLEKPKYNTKITGNETFLMKDGDIAFLDASEDLEGTSRAVLIDNPQNEPFIAGLHTILAKEKVVKLSKFYKQYITIPNSVKKQFQKLASGFKVYGINRDTIKKIEIVYPKSSQEQSRIAEILMQWDKAIELQEKLIKSYQKLKKYYLSKMFPKKGSLYPEIRFAGFTEPWEQRNASEIAEYDKGRGYSKCDLVESGTPVILYGRLYTKYQFAIDEVDTYAKIKDGAVLSKGGEVIIPASGETAEDIARASAITISGVLLGGDLNILRPYSFLNPIFLALSISNGESKNQLAKKAQGKTIVHIHNSDIKEVSIFYPSREEQDKIVDFLRSLDNISSLFQGRLNKLIEQRKALQQYLLTGIVRV